MLLLVIPISYMPMLEDIVSKVGQASVVSKLYMAKGYYQIRMAEQDVATTAFISPYGKYEFVRTLFGLKNAPSTFQRLMDKVLIGCEKFSAAYLDDVIVFSDN